MSFCSNLKVFLLIFTTILSNPIADNDEVSLDLSAFGPDYLDEFVSSLKKFLDENNVAEKNSFNFSYDLTFANGTSFDVIEEISNAFVETMSENLSEFQLNGTNQIFTDVNPQTGALTLKQLIIKISLVKEDEETDALKLTFESVDEAEIMKELEKNMQFNYTQLENGSIEEKMIFDTPQNITDEFSGEIGRIVLDFATPNLEDVSINIKVNRNCTEIDGERGQTKVILEITKNGNAHEQDEDYGTTAESPVTNVKDEDDGTTTESFETTSDGTTTPEAPGSTNNVSPPPRRKRKILEIIPFGGNANIKEDLIDRILNEDPFLIKIQFELMERPVNYETYIKFERELRKMTSELEPSIWLLRFGDFSTWEWNARHFCVAEMRIDDGNYSSIWKLKEKFPLVFDHRVSAIDKNVDLKETVQQILSYKMYTALSVPTGETIELNLPFVVKEQDEELEKRIIDILKSLDMLFFYVSSEFKFDEETSDHLLILKILIAYSPNKARNGVYAEAEEEAKRPRIRMNFKL